MQAFDRHFAACNNAKLPGSYLPLRIGAAQVGWVRPAFANALHAFDGIAVTPDEVWVRPTRPNTLQAAARVLSQEGLLRWRGEAFDVRAEEDGPVLTVLDRGALPAFGIQALGVHLNGLVRRPDGLHLWVAKRAANKLLDPGKLDNLVAGGVPAGFTPERTLLKEGREEAGVRKALLQRAVHVARIAYAMERPEGLRRDILHCYDLELPQGFVPRPHDDEIEHFELWPIQRVYETVRDTDEFKFNVNVVLVDLFRRLGMPT